MAYARVVTWVHQLQVGMLCLIWQELELVSDEDMHFFFEKDLRDGVSYISKIYSKALNKYLKTYNPKQKAKHIIY